MPVGSKMIRLPALPATLKADDILNAPDRDEFIQQSKSRELVLRFDRKSKKVLSLAERAATAYLRAERSEVKRRRPSTAPISKRKSSSFKSTSRLITFDNSSDTERKFEMDPGLMSGDVINDLFVYPELFISMK